MKVLLIIFFIPFLLSCSNSLVKTESSKLANSIRVSPGMSKTEVMNIMGGPNASEFDRNVEEWHYCATGYGSDKFVAFFFHNGNVVSKVSYTVTANDTGMVFGHCSNFIKRGTFVMPSKVIEIRAIIN